MWASGDVSCGLASSPNLMGSRHLIRMKLAKPHAGRRYVFARFPSPEPGSIVGARDKVWVYYCAICRDKVWERLD